MGDSHSGKAIPVKYKSSEASADENTNNDVPYMVIRGWVPYVSDFWVHFTVVVPLYIVVRIGMIY